MINLIAKNDKKYRINTTFCHRLFAHISTLYSIFSPLFFVLQRSSLWIWTVSRNVSILLAGEEAKWDLLIIQPFSPQAPVKIKMNFLEQTIT